MRTRFIRRISAVMVTIAMLLMVSALGGCASNDHSGTLRVAIPYSDMIQNIDQNYYVNWLREKTGLDIEITTIRQNRSEEYLDALFASDVEMDVVMFGSSFTITEEELDKYVRQGLICECADGKYYYPNHGSTLKKNAGQILWINYDWLMKLGLSVPKTTDELEKVLTAFYENDPNGNGEQDEIPLCGTVESYAFSPVELLLNSFVYNDPNHGRYAPAELLRGTAEETDRSGSAGTASDQSQVLICRSTEFRDGLRFCRDLYEKGLLDESLYENNLSGLRELINSPLDLVGAFTTDSISDVIYPGNPEIMAKFIHVTPLEGPEGVRYALYAENTPTVGAIINAGSNMKYEARTLLDTMMSTEASLIARFGEEGVDWEYSEGLDISIYGTSSTVVTKNYIWNVPQNKHLNGIGPMNVPLRYLEGVTWNGINSDAEYIDARARMTYAEYLPEVYSAGESDRQQSRYIDSCIRDFVTGEEDIDDDIAWKRFIEGL